MKITKKLLEKKGMYLWISFREKVFDELPDTELSVGGHESNDLEKNMYDSEIMKQWNIIPAPLPSVVGTMLSLVMKQKKGEDGALLTNGFSNIFYGESGVDGRTLVLSVYWDGGLWYWNCCELGEDGFWGAGYRVFSVATVASKETSDSLSEKTLGSLDTLTLDRAIQFCKENGLKVIRTKTIEEEL